MNQTDSPASHLRSRKTGMVAIVSEKPQASLPPDGKEPAAAHSRGDDRSQEARRPGCDPSQDCVEASQTIGASAFSVEAQPRRGRSDSEEDSVCEEEGEAHIGRPLLTGEGESWVWIMLQVLLPYLIAGFGMVAAGMVLDLVQHSAVFSAVSELFILVPALLGLKGNLEMTLASRLSTHANLGRMDAAHDMTHMIVGNLALVLAQATVVGFLASLFAMVMGWIPKGGFPLHHALLLCASSMVTATVASLVLGCLMVGVVLLSRRVQVNPDNVATPLAASLGDLTTLTLLALVSSSLYSAIEWAPWVAPALVGLLLLLLPVWVCAAVRNDHTQVAVREGWTPVLGAMVISSLGGLILDAAVSRYQGLAVFQPVMNGAGGNLAAVQASRISTALHRGGQPGDRVQGAPASCANPLTFLCASSGPSRAGRVLLLLVVPGHLLFLYTIGYLQAGHTAITPTFALLYLTAALMQVTVLLCVAQWLVPAVWRRGQDPDNVAIPYLTSIGDLLGTALLALAFHLLHLLGHAHPQ